MSIPPNPLPPQEPQLAPELAATPQQQPAFEPQALAASATGENPPWRFWDVLVLAIVAVAEMNFLAMVAILLVGSSHIFGYDLSAIMHNRSELDRFSHDPRVILPIQLVGYLIVLILMVWIVRARTGRKGEFFASVRWHWPHSGWPAFVVAGPILAIGILVASARLPIPHSLPIDKFFETATYAYLMSAFGILVAPFIEELFFRGFLYPSLARGFEKIARSFSADPLYRRNLGIAAGIVLTATAFMLVHGAQLGFSWAAMLLMFIVGAVLTLVRARTGSLAASVLLHMSYNATIFAAVFASTGGFRHLDRL